MIIVPNLNLITQFKSDMIEYGFDTDMLGEVWSNQKEWDKKVVISTWQSLAKVDEQLSYFDGFIVDEVHSAAALVLRDTIAKMTNAQYRFGCTGTLSDDDLDDFNVRSYLGPVFKQYSAKYLKEHGYLVDCQINQILLHYNSKFKGDFHKVKDEIFKNEFRMSLIKDKLSSVKSNLILMLVNKVEDEGQYFLDYLRSFDEFKDYEIQFISGKTKKDEREYWRQEAIKNDRKIILIATYPVFQAGINIPGLDTVFFLSPTKSKIRLLQSIGRSLRLYNKNDFTKEKAYIYDFVDDQNKWFEKHSEIRERHYDNNDFNIYTEEFWEKSYKSII